jgi:hypothetical protein
MSRKAKNFSFSAILYEGISPAMIFEKMVIPPNILDFKFMIADLIYRSFTMQIYNPMMAIKKVLRNAELSFVNPACRQVSSIV